MIVKPTPLSYTEMRWLDAALPEVDYASLVKVPYDVLWELYPEVLSFGPNHKRITELADVFRREFNDAADSCTDPILSADMIPIYDQVVEWFLLGNAKDGNNLLDFDELLHKVMTSQNQIIKSGLISISPSTMLVRKHLHDNFHSLAKDIVDDCDARVYGFQVGNSAFIHRAHEVLPVLFWALAGPNILPKAHPLEIQRQKWEKEILALIPEVANA